MQTIHIYTVLMLYGCNLNLCSILISPCAKWNSSGITFAGNGIPGDLPTQLSTPKGIFIVQRTNTLYVADFGNARVQEFSLNKPSSPGLTIISNDVDPSKIYVDDDAINGPTIYISVFIGNRVEKWMKGASKGIQIGGECRSCFGVAVDNEKNVYMSESDRHRIVKWLRETNLTIPVAGRTDERGPANDQLSEPDGIYFDRMSNTLYVADSRNNRIQKWTKDASMGITVAGSNASIPGDDNGSLTDPNGVWFDQQTKIVYIADTMNHRIMRWLPNATQGDVIVGGSGEGNASNQLNTPTDLAFDSNGNLYVCDNWNHRVQFFSLVENKPCSSTSKGTSQLFLQLDPFYSKTIIIIASLMLTLIIIE